MKRWFLNDFEDHGDGDISAFGPYHPWTRHKAAGGDGSNYPTFSGKILDLKGQQQTREAGIRYFYPIIAPVIRPDVTIVTVPSHDPSKTTNGIRELAQRICIDDPRVDGTEVLVRTGLVQKLAHGGDRSIDNHMKTIQVRSPHLIRGKKVLVLDDVSSTGNSLKACRALLLRAGAQAVHCAALGQTT